MNMPRFYVGKRIINADASGIPPNKCVILVIFGKFGKTKPQRPDPTYQGDTPYLPTIFPTSASRSPLTAAAMTAPPT